MVGDLSHPVVSEKYLGGPGQGQLGGLPDPGEMIRSGERVSVERQCWTEERPLTRASRRWRGRPGALHRWGPKPGPHWPL